MWLLTDLVEPVYFNIFYFSGLAFRYGPEAPEYPFSIVLAGTKCLHQTVPRSGVSSATRAATSQQLINLLPDMAT